MSRADDSLPQLMREAFAAIRAEAPALHARMVESFGDRTVRVTVGDTCFDVRREAEGLCLDLPSRAAAVSVETSAGALFDVVEGQSTFLDALMDNRITVRGESRDLLALHDSLTAYVHGAARAPSCIALWRRFAAAVRQTRRGRNESTTIEEKSA